MKADPILVMMMTLYRWHLPISGGICLTCTIVPLLRYSYWCMLSSQRHTHIANALERTSHARLVVWWQTYIMLGRRSMKFVHHSSVLVALVVVFAQVAPLDAASAQRGDLVYIEVADADGTSTLTVRLLQQYLSCCTSSQQYLPVLRIRSAVELQDLSSNAGI
jgi:hypothetical protein